MKAYTAWQRDGRHGDLPGDVASVLEGAAASSPGQPGVVLRLCLFSADGTGDERLVSSFLKPLSMPLALVSANVQVAIEIGGEPHVFEPASIIWDETHRVCIVEVWLAADGEGAADAIGDSEFLPV